MWHLFKVRFTHQHIFSIGSTTQYLLVNHKIIQCCLGGTSAGCLAQLDTKSGTVSCSRSGHVCLSLTMFWKHPVVEEPWPLWATCSALHLYFCWQAFYWGLACFQPLLHESLLLLRRVWLHHLYNSHLKGCKAVRWRKPSSLHLFSKPVCSSYHLSWTLLNKMCPTLCSIPSAASPVLHRAGSITSHKFCIVGTAASVMRCI